MPNSLKRQFAAHLRANDILYTSYPDAIHVGTFSLRFDDTLDYVTMRDAGNSGFSYATPYLTAPNLFIRFENFKAMSSKAKSIADTSKYRRYALYHQRKQFQ